MRSGGIPSPLIMTGGAAAADLLEGQVSGDTNYRFVLNADGSMEWGDGTSAADVTLSRSGAGSLRLKYDVSHYADWSVDASGFYILKPSGNVSASQVTASGGTSQLICDNLSNTASSHASISARVAGTSGGDASVNWTIAGFGSVTAKFLNSDKSWHISHSSVGDVIVMTATGMVNPGIDNTSDLGTSDTAGWRSLYLASPKITKGSGTGFTLNNSGEVRRLTYKCTLTFAGLAAAALTADKIIATLPAKAKITAIYADVTTKFIGGAVSAATLKIGSTVGGAEVLASFDCFTAAVTKGLADADLGTSLVRAAAIQGGFMPSFTATTGINVRLTTVTANTNALTQGVVVIYIECEVLP